MALAVKSPVLYLMIIAVILDIIAVAIPYWFIKEFQFTSVICGLWGSCTYPEIPASRGLHLTAMIVGIVGMIWYIVTEAWELLRLRTRRVFSLIFNLLAGAFILIGNCYMATNGDYKMHPASLSVSLVSAFLFAFVGGNLSSLEV